MTGGPEDPFDLGSLGDLFAGSDYDDVLFDDAEESEVLAAAVTAVGRASRTVPIGVDVARASVFGFDEQLAMLVLGDDALLEQLRGHWTRNGIPRAVQELAQRRTGLGRLHADLLARTGVDESAGDAGDAEESATVVAGPWTYRPRLVYRRAAKSADDDAANAFIARNDDWTMEVEQTATDDGDTVIELTFGSAIAPPYSIVRIVAGSVDVVLVCRPRGDHLVARTVVFDDGAWESNEIYRPLVADELPREWINRIPESVRDAPIAQVNLWRRLRRTLPDTHPVADAIDVGLA